MKKLLFIILGLVFFVATANAQNGDEADILKASYCWNDNGTFKDVERVTWFVPATDTPVKTIFITAGGSVVFPDTTELTRGTCIEYEIGNPPQECNCDYFLDQQNITYENIDNSQYLLYRYEKVVTRDCGAGQEEILRMPESAQTTQRKFNTYKNVTLPGVALLQNGAGFVDSFTVSLANPDTVWSIDLNPNTVLTSYPDLVGTLNPNDLIFNTGSPATMKAAFDLVIVEAIQQYAALSFLPVPAFDLETEVFSDGRFTIGFYVTHNPNGFYLNIDPSSTLTVANYFPDGINSNSAIEKASTTIGHIETATYLANCGLISTSYSAFMSQLVGATDWKTLSIESSGLFPPSLLGGIGTVTCQEPCPISVDLGCTPICDTVIVRMVDDEESCQVRGLPDHDRYTGFPGNTTLGQNSIHSIGFKVLSGTLKLVITGNDPVTGAFVEDEQFYEAGDVAHWTHPDKCKYLQRGFAFFTGSGNADVQVLILR